MWQEIFGNTNNDEECGGHPRSDELPPLSEPQESSEDESSESQMWKVMRTEVEEVGYWDENTEMSRDRKKCFSYLCIIKNEWQDVFVNLFLPNFRLAGQLTDRIFFI